MEHFGGGNWTMIPSIQSHSNPNTPSNQDHLFLQQKQFNQQQQFQQQFTPPPPQPRFHTQPQQQQNQRLASHFHIIHLVENLAEVTENGTRDQQTDALVSELNTQFEKCQQLLNSIGGTIKAKSTTVEGQKLKLEETENLLSQRRDLMSKYKCSVDEVTNSQV